MKTSVTVMITFFESGILKVTSSQLCSKFLLNNYGVHWRQHFERYHIVIYGYGSTHVLNFSSRLRQTWNKNRLKYLEKYQLHKNPRVQFEEHYIHLNRQRFTYFISFFFFQTYLLNLTWCWLAFFKDNFQLQNIFMFLFFTRNAYLLTAIVKCYFVLPRLSYIYWPIHFKVWEWECISF